MAAAKKIFAMFFFFRDGKKIVRKVLYYIPLNHDDEMLLVDRLSSVTRATIKGTLVIGIIQGALDGIGPRLGSRSDLPLHYRTNAIRDSASDLVLRCRRHDR